MGVKLFRGIRGVTQRLFLKIFFRPECRYCAQSYLSLELNSQWIDGAYLHRHRHSNSPRENVYFSTGTPVMSRQHIFLVMILGSAFTCKGFGQVPTGPQSSPQPSYPAYGLQTPQGSTAPYPTQPNAFSSPQVPGGAGIYDPLEQYRARELYTRFSFWKGQEVVRGGKTVDIGYFGGGYQDVFAGSPAALDSMSTFRTLRITGTVLWVAGLAILVTDIVLLGSESNSIVDKDSRGQVTSVKPLYWGLLIPGGVLGISGGVMMQGANGYLSDAINQYNSDLTLQIGGRPVTGPLGRAPGLTVRGSF